VEALGIAHVPQEVHDLALAVGKAGQKEQDVEGFGHR
jgi:hypothetical protein